MMVPLLSLVLIGLGVFFFFFSPRLRCDGGDWLIGVIFVVGGLLLLAITNAATTYAPENFFIFNVTWKGPIWASK